MKKLTYLFIVLLTITACKDKKETPVPMEDTMETPEAVETPKYQETRQHPIHKKFGCLDTFSLQKLKVQPQHT